MNLKREECKNKKLRGEKYVNSQKNEMPAKVFSSVTHSCKDKCYEKFSFQTQCSLYDSFYCGQEKSLQDSYLASCMTKSKNTKCDLNQVKPGVHTWKYSVKRMGGITS